MDVKLSLNALPQSQFLVLFFTDSFDPTFVPFA